MSWAVEEWKDGLPARALQRVTEMETQLEKLRKDQRQRQMQIDTVEGAYEKQKKKVEEAKSEISALKRENQSLMDACDSLQTAREKLGHELQHRETQAQCLEGQLASARSHTDKIEQELRRCKNELECRSSASCFEVQTLSAPHQQVANNSRETNSSDEKYEHLHEKYSTEVAERKRLEQELKVLQIKLVNQTQATTSTSRQAISRQQASSSIFPWQKQDTTTPARRDLFTGVTPLKCTSTSSVFPWENEPVSATKRCGSALSALDAVPAKRGSFSVPALERPVWANAATRDDPAFGQDQCGGSTRNVANESMSSHSQARELEQRVHHQEMELEGYASKLSVAMGQLESAGTELADKKRSLINSQNELSRLNVQHEQALAKVTALEQKLKHMAEELNCQRQNAESARLVAEQRLKDKEREQQEEVARLEHNINGLDQQLNQTKIKFDQAVQHTKNEHNALQAEFDKALLQKQHLEKEVQELKQVLQKANDDVKLYQDMTKDAKCSLEEATKEKINLTCNLEQSAHRARKFEDDMKNLKQELHDSRRVQEDLQSKVISQETEVENMKSKLEKQSKSLNGNVDNLKIIISDLEKKRDAALAVAKKNEFEMEKMHCQLSASKSENEDLHSKWCHKTSECSSLENENVSLVQLKKEMSDNLNKLKLERDVLAGKVQGLEVQIEQILSAPLEKQNTDMLEQENTSIKAQLCELKQELDKKSVTNTTLEERIWALEKELEECANKQSMEMIELRNSSTLLSEEVARLHNQLSIEKTACAELKDSAADLKIQLTDINNLMNSKEHLLETKEAELNVLKDALLTIVEEFEKTHWTLFEQKANTNEEFRHKMMDLPEQNFSTIQASVRLMHYFTVLGENVSTLQLSLISHAQEYSELKIKYEAQLIEKSKSETQKVEISALYAKLQSEFDQNTCTMAEKLKEQASKFENVQRVIEEKNTTLEDISSKLEDTQANFVLQQEMNKILQLDLEEAHNKLRLNSEQIESFATQSKESNSYLAKVLEENVCLKNQANAFEDFTSRQNQVMQYAETINELEVTINSLKTKFENEINSRDSRCNQLQDDVCGLKGHNVILEQENQCLQTLKGENEIIINNLEIKLLQAENDSTQATNLSSKVEKELANLQEQYTASVEKQTTVEYMLSEREKELSSKVLEIAQVKNDALEALEQLMSTIKQLEESKSGFVEKLKQAELQESANNDKISSLMAEAEIACKQFKEEIAMLNGRLSDAEEDNRALWMSNQMLEQNIRENEQQLGSIEEKNIGKQNDYSKTYEQMNVIIEEQTAQLKQLEGENFKIKASLHEKHLELEELKAKLEASTFDLQKTSANLEMLQMDLEEKDVTLELYELQKKQRNDSIESLDITSKNQNADILKQELEKMRMNCDELTGQLLKRQASAESLGCRVAEQEKLLSDLRGDVENAHCRGKYLLEKLHSVQEQLENSLLEGDHLRTVVDNRNGDICSKDKVIYDLTKALKLSEDNAFKVRNVCDDLQSEANAFKEQLTEIQSHGSLTPLTGTNNGDGKKAVNVSCKQQDVNICSSPSSEQNASVNLQTEFCQLNADYSVLSEEFRNLKTNYDAFQRTCSLQSDENAFLSQEKILSGSLFPQALEEREALRVENNKSLLLQGQYDAQQNCKNELQGKLQQAVEHGVELNSVIESPRTPKIVAETLIQQRNNVQVECHELHRQVHSLQEKLQATQDLLGHVLIKANCNSVQQLPRLLEDNIDMFDANVESFKESSKCDVIVQSAHTEDMHQDNDLVMSIESADPLNNVINGAHTTDIIMNEENVSESLGSSQIVLDSNKADECELSCNADILQKENSAFLKHVTDVETNHKYIFENIKSLKQDFDSPVFQCKHEQANASDMIDKMHSLELDRTLLVNKIPDFEKDILSLEVGVQNSGSKNTLTEELQNGQTQLSRHKEEVASVKDEYKHMSAELHNFPNTRVTLQTSVTVQNSELSPMRLEKVQTELICSLEAELLDLKERLKSSEEGLLQLSNEKEELCNKLQNLYNEALIKDMSYKEKVDSIELLNHMKELAEQKAETSQSQLECLKNEHSRVLESMETALRNKAVLGKQLNLTKETIHELKRYIAKLKLILEADDRKRKEMEEKIAHSERKHDTLQDTIEQLQRELEMSEGSLEDMVMRQESIEEDFKTAVDEKNAAIENYKCLKAQLDLVSAEKQKLVEEVKEKQHQVDEAKSTIMTLQDALQRQQEDNINTRTAFDKHSSQMAVEMACQLNTAAGLQEETKLLNEQLLSCKAELQEWQRKEDEWRSKCHAQTLDCESMQERAAAAESQVANLKDVCQTMSVELQSVPQVLSDLRVERNVALAELQGKQQTLVEELHQENRGRLEEIQAENQRALTALHSQHDQQLLSAQANYDSTLGEMCAEHEALRVEMVAKYEEASMENQALKFKLKTLQEAHQHMEVTASISRTEHLEERAALEDHLKDLHEQVSSQEKNIAILKLAKEQDDSKLKDAEKCKQELDAKVTGVEADKVQLTNEKAALQGRLRLWTSNAQQLEKEKEELHKRIQKLEGKLKAMQGQGSRHKKVLREGEQMPGKRGRKSDIENKAKVKRMKPFPEESSIVPSESSIRHIVGLPKDTKIGFADIPLVLKTSPHVIRRTTMHSRTGETSAASCSSPARMHPVTDLQPKLPSHNTIIANNSAGKEQGIGNLPPAGLGSPLTVITNSPNQVAPGCGSSKPAGQRSLRVAPEQREKHEQTRATSEAISQLDENCKMQ